MTSPSVAAGAKSVRFTPPVDAIIDRSAVVSPPEVLVERSGRVTLAWFASGGVKVSERLAGGGAWTTPQTIAPRFAASLTAATNARGDRALLWVDSNDEQMRISVAPSGAAFGAPQLVPTPEVPLRPWPEGPPCTSSSDGTSASAGCEADGPDWHSTHTTGPSPQLALADDGTVAIAYRDRWQHNYGQQSSSGDRVGLTLRTMHDGAMTTRVVSDDEGGEPALAAGGETFTIAWCGRPVQTPDAAWRIRASDIAAGVASPATDASSADREICHPHERPFVTGNTQRDTYVVWNYTPTKSPSDGMPFPITVTEVGYQVQVIGRSAGAAWSAPSQLDDQGGQGSVAINAAGQATAAWLTPAGLGWAESASGSDLGDPREVSVANPGQTMPPVMLDESGNKVVVYTRGVEPPGPKGYEPEILAASAARGGDFDAPVVVNPRARVGEIAAAGDGMGNGVVAWQQEQSITTSTFSTSPPRISRLRSARGRVSLRISEPARLRVSLVSGKRTAGLRSRAARPGRFEIAMTRAMRRLAGRAGARVVVRARDAGPGIAIRSAEAG